MRFQVERNEFTEAVAWTARTLPARPTTQLQVLAGLPEDELVALAKGSPKVQAYLNGQEPRAFVVPDKLVNLVV